MSSRAASQRLTTHTHRPAILISYLFILVVALRRQYDLIGGFTIQMLLILFGIFVFLFSLQTLFRAKLKPFQRIYFALQTIIILIIGAFQSYQDVWAFLFFALGFQVAVSFPRKEAMVWFSMFAVSLLLALSIEFGPLSGMGRALAYIIMGIILIAYDVQYAQHEDALAESQMLVAEVQEAHRKLEEYASQGEKLAALQQRDHMIQQLYDSVGQKIFAIQLAAETTRLILVKEPEHALDQINQLQSQTQSALGQMRQLIEQWRPD